MNEQVTESRGFSYDLFDCFCISKESQGGRRLNGVMKNRQMLKEIDGTLAGARIFRASWFNVRMYFLTTSYIRGHPQSIIFIDVNTFVNI